MTGFLKLWISGEGLPLDEVTNRFGIQPTYSYKKGDTYYDKITKETITYIEDCWLFNKEIETEQFEQKIFSFVNSFKIETEYIKSLAKKFKTFLWLAVYPEREQEIVHLSHKISETIYKLGLPIEIEIADLREFYDGTYLSKNDNAERKNGDMINLVDFRISGKSIDFEGVNQALNIIPDYICKNGNVDYDKTTNQTYTYSEDCWIAGIKIENADKTEERILEFINLFYKNKEYVKQLSNMHNITLWITLSQDTNQYNLTFTQNVLGKISELGIDVNIICV